MGGSIRFMSKNTKHHKLLEVLRNARELLARPDNDFAWSSWHGAEDAMREIDGLIVRIEAGSLPERSDVTVLFLPTGPIQEVSVSSGWGREFLALADRLDAAVDRAYGSDVFTRLMQFVCPNK